MLGVSHDRGVPARPVFLQVCNLMLRSKLPDVGTTIFSVMSQLAAQHDAVNLGQGYPDFNADPRLLELVTQAMSEGHNQYAPMTGIPALREAIAQKTSALSGHTYRAEDEITVTSGATEALMVAVMASVGPGDEVIVLEPAYDSYGPAIRLAGATPVPVAMTAPDAAQPLYRPDWDRVRDAITQRTKVIMLNFPHNPTGAILHEADLDALETILAGTDILVISDEVYEHIVFDGNPHLSMASRPALAARSFVISSFGKTLHTTGWKIGYCCAPQALSAEFRKIHQFLVYSVPTPMQHGIAAYLANPLGYMNLASFYQLKRDRLADGLAATRLKALPCPGTFFMLADYSAVSDLPQAEFARWLTVNHGVTVIPVSAFHTDTSEFTGPDAPRIVRLCFAKRDITLNTALERLTAL